MKVFISGPIQNVPGFNRAEFVRAEKCLTRQGHAVMNPIKLHPKNPLSFGFEDYIHVCFAMIDICDAIYLLDGWKLSKGANKEKAYAEAHGKLITNEESVCWQRWWKE